MSQSFGIDWKIDEAKLESMIQTFGKELPVLEEVNGIVASIATAMEKDALQGDAGDEFQDVLKKDAKQAIDDVYAKIKRLQSDVQFSLDSWRRWKADMEKLINDNSRS